VHRSSFLPGMQPTKKAFERGNFILFGRPRNGRLQLRAVWLIIRKWQNGSAAELYAYASDDLKT
jgi:hypothetical protein